MNAIDEILGMLNDDIVDHGWVQQIINYATSPPAIEIVLEELLASGRVEIGNARAIPDHVEFIAWTGSIAERVNRAMEAVSGASEDNKPWAYWLCLRENVDRFE